VQSASLLIERVAAQSLEADVVGADRAAFARLSPRYLRFR
jgi:hypothetical protein